MKTTYNLFLFAAVPVLLGGAFSVEALGQLHAYHNAVEGIGSGDYSSSCQNPMVSCAPRHTLVRAAETGFASSPMTIQPGKSMLGILSDNIDSKHAPLGYGMPTRLTVNGSQPRLPVGAMPFVQPASAPLCVLPGNATKRRRAEFAECKKKLPCENPTRFLDEENGNEAVYCSKPVPSVCVLSGTATRQQRIEFSECVMSLPCKNQTRVADRENGGVRFYCDKDEN